MRKRENYKSILPIWRILFAVGWLLATGSLLTLLIDLQRRSTEGNYRGKIQVLAFDAKARVLAENDGALATIPFTDFAGRSTALGLLISDTLEAEISRVSPGTILIDRNDLQAILDEKRFTLSGDVDPGSSIRLGRMRGARLLLRGRVLVQEDGIFIVTSITDTETGQILWKREAIASSSSYLRRLALLPPDGGESVGNIGQGGAHDAKWDLAKDFFVENWPWLWTVILVPLSTWLIRRPSRASKKPGAATEVTAQ